jgi:hypothetical protein
MGILQLVVRVSLGLILVHFLDEWSKDIGSISFAADFFIENEALEDSHGRVLEDTEIQRGNKVSPDSNENSGYQRLLDLR